MKDRHNFIEFYITGIGGHALLRHKIVRHKILRHFCSSTTCDRKYQFYLSGVFTVRHTLALNSVPHSFVCRTYHSIILRHQTDPTFLYRNINYQRKDLKLKKQKSRTSDEKGKQPIKSSHFQVVSLV